MDQDILPQKVNNKPLLNPMTVVKWQILCLLQCQRQIKKLWSTEPALYCAWTRTMKLFTWPSWELYLFHLLVKLEWLLRNVFYSRQSVLVGFHKDKPHGLNKHISSITFRLLINLSFLIPFLSRINVFFFLLWRFKYVHSWSHFW